MNTFKCPECGAYMYDKDDYIEQTEYGGIHVIVSACTRCGYERDNIGGSSGKLTWKNIRKQLNINVDEEDEIREAKESIEEI